LHHGQGFPEVGVLVVHYNVI